MGGVTKGMNVLGGLRKGELYWEKDHGKGIIIGRAGTGKEHVSTTGGITKRKEMHWEGRNMGKIC